MKFKFYYVKHRVTVEFVASATFVTGEGDTYTTMFLSKWESDQPYLSTREDLQRLIDGQYNNSWSIDVYKCIQHAIVENQLEIIEVEL